MKTIYVKQHKAGNHSASQVYCHGATILEGSAKEAKEEYRRMKKFCRKKWYESSTTSKQRDFVSEQMADIFLVEIINGKPQFYNF